MSSFSERQGYISPAKIKYKDELPEILRHPMIEILSSGLSFHFMLDRAIAIFDPYGLGTLPRSRGVISVVKGDSDVSIKFKRIFLACDWFQVYDLVEDLFEQLKFHEEELADPTIPEEFRSAKIQEEMNKYFRYSGIGWQIVDGRVLSRSDEVFESILQAATQSLQASGRFTAAKHLSEAVASLSRRPEPNFSGAVFHAMGSLECVARDVTGESNLTLGEILKRVTNLVPKPLDTALSQIWGYASNEARHVREGREPKRPEAELMVGLSATLTYYLTERNNDA